MRIYPSPLAAFVVASSAVFAGTNSAVISLPVETQRVGPAVCLIQNADYACAVVQVRGTAKEADRQMAAAQDALQRISAATQRSNVFQLHQGPVRFAGGGSNSSSFILSKSAYVPGGLQTTLRVLCPLSPGADVFDAMRQLTLFINKIDLPGDVELRILSTTLAVSGAELQRDRLMQLIRDQIAMTRQQLGANIVTVSGLDSPVLVRQLDNVNVELFIDYHLSASLEK